MTQGSGRHAGIAIIGVVGNSNVDVGEIANLELLKSAWLVGRLIAESGHILLTGGHHLVPEHSVKHAALLGTLDIGATNRIVGIVGIPPDKFTNERKKRVGEVEEGSSNDHLCHWVYAHTGFTSGKRNPLTGQTPDVLIALKGKHGTPQEVSEALKVERPVVFLKSWTILKDELTVKPKDGQRHEANSEEEAVDKALGLVDYGGRLGSGFPTQYKGLPEGIGTRVVEAITRLRERLRQAAPHESTESA